MQKLSQYELPLISLSGYSVSIPSVRKKTLTRSQSTQKKSKCSKRKSPVRLNISLSQLPLTSTVSHNGDTSPDEFQEDRLSKLPKKYRKKLKRTNKRWESDSSDQEIWQQKPRKERPKLKGKASKKLKSNRSLKKTKKKTSRSISKVEVPDVSQEISPIESDVVNHKEIKEVKNSEEEESPTKVLAEFFVFNNNKSCDGTKKQPDFNLSDVGSENGDIETALIKVCFEQEELILTNKCLTPVNNHRILETEQSAKGSKKKSCRKRLFEDKEFKESTKFVIKQNQDRLSIKIKKKRRKPDVLTDDESKDVHEKERKLKEKRDSSDNERVSENLPCRSMPTLDIYDSPEPISPTPRKLPKIIEVQKLDRLNLLDLNNLASPISTPSRFQHKPDFELAGESLLPLEPVTTPNLEVDVQMMSETEKEDILEPPVLEEKESTSSVGSLRSADEEMQLDRVVDSPHFGDPRYLTFNNQRGVKASKTSDLNDDFADLWIHEAATPVVYKNKIKHTDLVYSSTSLSSDEEFEEKVEKEKKDEDRKTEDEKDNNELEEDHRYQNAKNYEEESEKENEKTEDAKSNKLNEEDLEDCISILYSDEELV